MSEPLPPQRAANAGQRAIVRIEQARSFAATDRLAIEEPLEIRLDDEPLAVTMRTPGDDLDLAAGFCLTEGVIQSAADLRRLETCGRAGMENVVLVTLEEHVRAARHAQIAGAERRLYLSSSCGICGKAALDRIAVHIPPIAGRFSAKQAVLARLPEAMRAAQSTFDATGGLHAAAIFSPQGELIVLREDVGRHNAVDKVIGAQLRANQLPLDPAILLVSGRASFEIIQKAAVAGIAMIAAISAPSSLAVDLAESCGITLVGFLRPGRMNVYSGAERVCVD